MRTLVLYYFPLYYRMRNLFTVYFNGEDRTLIIIPIVAVVYMGLLYLFVVSTFFLASFVDPGIYPRGMLMRRQVMC